jgi:C-terminal processing protease CtpA/Prc
MFLLLLLVLFLAGPGWGANPFGGVGVDGVPRADGSIVVKQLVLGGPAQLAGVRAGDVITQIDGKPTIGSDFRVMVDHRLRGAAGTRVALTVRRPGSARPLSFNLIRRQLVPAAARKKEQQKGE